MAESAHQSEIKSAFRKLAKLYHPDINPSGQEEFKKILKAYETLINPSYKASYDMKLKYHRNAGQKKTTTSASASAKKNWSFDEKEMKRRQYYNDYIKKFEKSSGYTKAQDIDLKNNYNEYKYILFATPLAVALFLLIMYFATNNQPKQIDSHYTPPPIVKTLKMGDAPYLDHFGTQFFFGDNGKSITIKNYTGSDIIICLFNENKFLRSCFISNGFYAEIPQLPKKPIEVRYSSGSNWNHEFLLKEVNLYGAFTKDLNFYKSMPSDDLGGLNELTLNKGINEGFTLVDQKQFFNKN